MYFTLPQFRDKSYADEACMYGSLKYFILFYITSKFNRETLIMYCSCSDGMVIVNTGFLIEYQYILNKNVLTTKL